MAEDDRPVEISQMPAKAQQFIQKYFPESKIALAKQEGIMLVRSYDVIFINGDKVEFDRKGNWTNIDCKYTFVPDGITPAPIDNYIKANYPQAKLKGIEKEDRCYEVQLNNDIDLKFTHSFKLIEIDM